MPAGGFGVICFLYWWEESKKENPTSTLPGKYRDYLNNLAGGFLRFGSLFQPVENHRPRRTSAFERGLNSEVGKVYGVHP